VRIVEKLIAGDAVRRTRFHTEAGAACQVDGVPGVIPAAWTWLRSRMGAGSAPEPWWVWEASRFVAQHLRPSDHVLEAGSGNSTLWLAKRCAAVHSIEEDPKWRDRVARDAQCAGLENVTLHAGRSETVFRDLLDRQAWDVVVIDSPCDRLRMFRRLLLEQRPRVVVYDDTDRVENQAALDPDHDYDARTFRGFKPQTLHTCETTVFMRPETLEERCA
jgi:hypothetical protein